jgi:ketosteroid isomerase-like protein
LDRVGAAFVAEVVDALNARDIPRLTAYIHPDVEYHSILGEVEGEPYRGRESVGRYFADLADGFESVQWRTLDTVEGTSGRLVVAFEMEARGRASGVEFRRAFWQVWTVRDGLVWRNETFNDREEALRVAGLEA